MRMMLAVLLACVPGILEAQCLAELSSDRESYCTPNTPVCRAGVLVRDAKITVDSGCRAFVSFSAQALGSTAYVDRAHAPWLGIILLDAAGARINEGPRQDV